MCKPQGLGRQRWDTCIVNRLKSVGSCGHYLVTASSQPSQTGSSREKKPAEVSEGRLAHSGFRCNLQFHWWCYNFLFLWFVCFLRDTQCISFVRWLIAQYSLFCLKAAVIPSGKVLKDHASKAWLPGFRRLALPLVSSVTLTKFLSLCPGFLLCEMEGLRAPVSLRLSRGLNMSTCKRRRREMLAPGQFYARVGNASWLSCQVGSGKCSWSGESRTPASGLILTDRGPPAGTFPLWGF